MARRNEFCFAGRYTPTVPQLCFSQAGFNLQEAWPELNTLSSCSWVPPFLFLKPVAGYTCCLDFPNAEALNLARSALFVWELFLGGNKGPGPHGISIISRIFTLLPVFALRLREVGSRADLDCVIYIIGSCFFLRCLKMLLFSANHLPRSGNTLQKSLLSLPPIVMVSSSILLAFTLREWSCMGSWHLKGQGT